MFFIALLIVTTMAIASSAAFFSVYGLASTFSGTFWSVVVMGASLEAGKLMAASYLYRYWDKTHIALRTYLMIGVLALMVMTSVGVFGYLSTGYSSDILPLKQKTEQVNLLDAERTRNLERKKQIDDLMAGATSVRSVQKGDALDPNAARVLRETTKSRESLVRQYKTEQQQVTARITELDNQLLPLKQDLIKTEAHIGPIMYIAKAFNLDSDNATKYLIYLIIFAFDPMAVALTLAVNIAIRLRKEEKDKKKDYPIEENVKELTEVTTLMPVTEEPTEPLAADVPATISAPPLPDIEIEGEDPISETIQLEFMADEELNDIIGKSTTPLEESLGAEPDSINTQEEHVYASESSIENTVDVAESAPLQKPTRHTRPYAGLWTGNVDIGKINELISHYQYLKNKQDNHETLTKDETWEFAAIQNVLQKHGYSMYL